MPEYNLAMANTSCSLNIHCIFSTKERAPLLNPELRERLWPFLGGIAKQNGIMPRCNRRGCVSVSQLPETIHSIQNQVEHHRSRTFQQEDLAFLKRHEHSTRCRLLMPGLSFDDKYLWD
jgi:hypothetical protein